MRHVPHVLVEGPWPEGELVLPDGPRHHLERVLRLRTGDPLHYTDGCGRMGAGTFGTSGSIVRGTERVIPPPSPPVVLAVAPPHRTERARFVVEKLAEMGVDRLVWLETGHGQAGPPHPDKQRAWAVSALEQSRGAHLMVIGGPTTLRDLAAGQRQRVVVADPAGHPIQPTDAGDPGVSYVVAIGPEGGWAPGDVPDGVQRISLGGRTLRTETAAIVAATLFLQVTGRFHDQWTTP